MKFPKGLWAILFTLILIFIWGYNLPLVITKEIAKEKSLYKLDSVRMLSRAYPLTATKSSNISGYEFQDETNHHFRLENPYFSGIVSNSRLYDTLQYSDLVMTILTDEEGFTNFRSSTKNIIYIHQLYIGGKPYIDPKKTSEQSAKAARDRIIFFSIAYVVGLAFYIYKRRRT